MCKNKAFLSDQTQNTQYISEPSGFQFQLS